MKNGRNGNRLQWNLELLRDFLRGIQTWILAEEECEVEEDAEVWLEVVVLMVTGLKDRTPTRCHHEEGSEVHPEEDVEDCWVYLVLEDGVEDQVWGNPTHIPCLVPISL